MANCNKILQNILILIKGDEDSESDSEIREEVHQSQDTSSQSQIYKRKIKQQRRLTGRQGSGISCSKTDIHPDLTLEKVHNPPDTRRGVLPSFGSRYLNSKVLQNVIELLSDLLVIHEGPEEAQNCHFQ